MFPTEFIVSGEATSNFNKVVISPQNNYMALINEIVGVKDKKGETVSKVSIYGLNNINKEIYLKSCFPDLFLSDVIFSPNDLLFSNSDQGNITNIYGLDYSNKITFGNVICKLNTNLLCFSPSNTYIVGKSSFIMGKNCENKNMIEIYRVNPDNEIYTTYFLFKTIEKTYNYKS